MIIKIHAAGKSFKGLVQYLGHDPQAKSKERVAWTHTLNTASDHPSVAMHEIYWTYKAAKELKREAGVRKGGQLLKSPVKHFSLSWNPDDIPSREHMVDTVENFLKHMGWHEHQAVLFAHNDTAHPHVHVVLNAVHPETGLKLDDGNDWTRAERWGLAYELERGDVRCQQRLKHLQDRTPTPTRATWQQLRAHEREDVAYEASRRSDSWDYLDRKSPDERRDREWEALKEHQKEEREAFFAGGKAVYREVSQTAYRQVRHAFRSEWKEYYALERDGLGKDDLARLKSDLLSRQKAELHAEWQKGSEAKRAERDIEYADIKSSHREQRRQLREAQEQGRSYSLLDILHAPRSRREKDTGDRLPRSINPRRETWDALRSYRDGHGAPPQQRNAHDRNRQERAVLRQAQQEDRDAFNTKGGKEAFRSVRKEARLELEAEMRPTFSAIQQASASGHDRTQLASLKYIRLRQLKEMGKFRSDMAAARLKDDRSREKDERSDLHKAERLVLRRRQLRGLRTYRVVDKDRALVSADEAAKLAQARTDARQQAWRQTRPEASASMNRVEGEAARFAAALRSNRERESKVAEFEERVQLAWRRTRSGPGRGRD